MTFIWIGSLSIEGAKRCINIELISELAVGGRSSGLIKICKFGHHHRQILTEADIKPKCQIWRDQWRSTHLSFESVTKGKFKTFIFPKEKTLPNLRNFHLNISTNLIKEKYSSLLSGYCKELISAPSKWKPWGESPQKSPTKNGWNNLFYDHYYPNTR